MKSAALFDFDKTIVSKDTGFEFILFALKRNKLRALFAIIALPFALLFFTSNRLRFIGNSTFLWLATCGLNRKNIAVLREQFISDYLRTQNVKVYPLAIARIKQHQANNDQVIIASGSSKWMVKKTFIKLGISNITIIGSREMYFFQGMVANEHCYSKNKIKMIRKIVELDQFAKITGYSDSSADIPLISLCDTKMVINPKIRCLRKFKKSFGNDFKVLHWV
jgi:phosphatidylglycerophosphatase C